MIQNYQNNFWSSENNSRSSIKHQKLHGKLSEHAVSTIQTVGAAFYF